MEIEGHGLNSGKIEDKVLAEKMARAGDKYRTIAAKGRASAEALENPRTIADKIRKLILGEKAKSLAEQMRSVAVSADAVADSKEKTAVLRDSVQEEVRNLSYENLEILVNESFQDFLNVAQKLIDQSPDEETDVSQLRKEETGLRNRWFELYKLLNLRKAVKDRVAQEKDF